MEHVVAKLVGKTIRISSAVFLVVGFLALDCFGVPGASTETFTGITSYGYLSGDYHTLYKYELNGPTTVTSPEHYRTNNVIFASPAYLDGEGIADFGTLKSRVRIWGPGALNGHSQSLWNDHWTVENPQLTGTQGTMQLAFDLSGTTTVLDTGGNPVATDEFSTLTLSVLLNPHDDGSGTSKLYFWTNLSPGPTVIGPTVTAPITFTYGTPFGIQTRLGVWAETDNHWLYESSNPFFIHYGGGTIDDVTIDFLSTAELTGIIIPDDADALVTGTSSTDYTGLVVTQIPLPATLWLLLGGLPVLARAGRRKS